MSNIASIMLGLQIATEISSAMGSLGFMVWAVEVLAYG